MTTDFLLLVELLVKVIHPFKQEQDGRPGVNAPQTGTRLFRHLGALIFTPRLGILEQRCALSPTTRGARYIGNLPFFPRITDKNVAPAKT